MSAILVDGVSKRFRLQTDRAHSLKELVTRRDRNAGVDQFWALKDVSIEIPEGSMYALVGHNGSGKSTLLRCIAGIYRPTEGSVKVQGRISTLLELGAGFHPDLSGRENVYLNATILGMSKKEIDRQFDDIVAFAGVEQFIDSPVKVYSSGMYVRLGFSVAVHVQPEILIIDEVIAVGDEQFQRRCFDHLYSLRKQGVTIVVVTHGMSTVETMCDGAAWLDHGRLQLVGSGPEVAAAYLRKVNAVEAEERDAEAALAAAAGGPPSAAPGTSAGATTSGEPISVTAVTFADDAGEEVTQATHGQTFRLRVHYDATEPVEEPVFGFALHALNGVHVSGTNTQIAELSTGTVSGRGVIEFAVPALPLNPGEYEISIAIADRHLQHMYVRRDREWRFIIRHGEGLPPHGLMDLRGHWQFVPEEGTS